MDITFHALTCSDVHLDAMDVAGDNQLNMEQDMFKQRLSPQGKFIGRPGREIIGHKNDNSELFVAPLVAGACESCYGAESELHPCCNSCNEVRMRYKEKGWNDNIVLRNSTQCLRDSTNPFASVRMGEGCRVSGVMHVNKVAGNVHMALGTSVVRDGSHIHQFLPQDAPGFNVSHTINSLSFGTIHPGMPSNPLDSGTSLCIIPLFFDVFCTIS